MLLSHCSGQMKQKRWLKPEKLKLNFHQETNYFGISTEKSIIQSENIVRNDCQNEDWVSVLLMLQCVVDEIGQCLLKKMSVNCNARFEPIPLVHDFQAFFSPFSEINRHNFHLKWSFWVKKPQIDYNLMIFNRFCCQSSDLTLFFSISPR